MNKLYYGDNLPILRDHFDDASVDLIYLDPPFNSNRDYNVLFRDESGLDSDAQILAFGDSWHWGPTAEATWHDLVTGNDNVGTLMSALRQVLGENQMMAYLVMMCARLIELRRVLKPTGSIYLHCDDSASHYLKMIMDVIFGAGNFRNHIAWRRAVAHNDPRRFGRIHDSILFYSLSDEYYWEGESNGTTRTEEEIAVAYPSQDERGRFRADNLTGPLHSSKPGSPSTIPWRGYDVFAMGRCWSVPKTGRYAEYIEREFIPGYRSIEGIHERLEALDAADLIYHPKRGRWPGLKRYADADRGIPPQDIILDPIGFTNFSAQRGEYLDYPTQKPLALLEKLIKVSCPPDGVVLDPFCGCGTAVVAAEQLGRQWIGIDITHLSVAMMKARLHDECNGLRAGVDYEVIGEPTTLQDARQLALDDRYQFQFWALSLVQAQPLNNERKKGADRGIDGVLGFVDGSGRRQRRRRVLAQVKSGGVSSSDIRDLRGTVEREDAAMGVFITLAEPTGPMQREAVSAGFFEPESWSGRYPRLQILTIEQLLDGAQVDMPLMRRQPRVAEDEMSQGGLNMPPNGEPRP
ncbi:MAG: DNA methyltransferase [Anaerolineaceae bacterium]|nr:DNA methyltransferase [Anaerolineaceae bacterium]MDE0328680.1 DNA methyltransferase [Anaerolineaceae bacterium]